MLGQLKPANYCLLGGAVCCLRVFTALYQEKRLSRVDPLSELFGLVGNEHTFVKLIYFNVCEEIWTEA